MYPCTKCGLPLDGPVCPRCGQAHSSPGRPVDMQPGQTQPPMTPWDESAPGPAMMAPAPVGGGPPPTPPGAAPAPRGPSTTIAVAAISLVVLVGLVVLGWGYFFSGGGPNTKVAPSPTAEATLAPPPTPTVDSDPTATHSAPPTVETLSPSPAPNEDTVTPITPEPATAPTTETEITVDVQEAARAELELRRADSLPFVTLDGRWVAVLSTKKSGITDPEQTAKNGSHVFYEDDILALHEELALEFAGSARVLLVKTSDFGKQRKNGDVFWRTIADAGFTSKEAVTLWCAEQYSGTQKEIENSCLPSAMVPPTQP